MGTHQTIATLPTNATTDKAVRTVEYGCDAETRGASQATPIPVPAIRKGMAQQAARLNAVAIPLVTSATAPVDLMPSFMTGA